MCVLHSSRSTRPSTPLLPMVCRFFEFPVSVLHHPVHELLSRSSSSPLLLHSFPTIFLCKELPLIMYNVPYPLPTVFSQKFLQQLKTTLFGRTVVGSASE